MVITPPPVRPLVTLKERDGIAAILVIATITAMTASSVTDNESNKAAYQTFAYATGSATLTVSSIGTAGTSEIHVVLSEDVTVNNAAPGDFVLSGNISTDPTVTGIEAVADTLVLTLSDTLGHDDDIRLAYTKTTGSIDDIPAPPSFVGSFPVGSQDTFPTGLAFSADGTRMFVVGLSGADVNEYALTAPFDVSTSAFVGSFSVNSEETTPRGLAFSADGTRMFVVGNFNDAVNEYALTAAFDVSNVTLARSFSVASQASQPQGLAFSADGTKMFVVSGGNDDDVDEYALAAPFDISNVTFVDSFPVASGETTPRGLAFSADGTRMFVTGNTGDAVYEYALTAAFDVSTAAFVGSFSVASEDTSLFGLTFSSDGTRMFVSGTTNDVVYQYALSEPFTLLPQPNSLASFAATQVTNNIMTPPDDESTGGSDASGQSEDAMVNVLPTLRYDVGYGTIANDLSLLTTDHIHPTYHNAINLRQPGSDNPWIAVFPDSLTTTEGGSLVASGDPIRPYDYHNLTNQVPAITCATDNFGHDPTMLAEFDYIPGATYTGTDTFDIVIKEFIYTGDAESAACLVTGATETIPVEITVGEKPSVTFRDDFTKFSNSSGVVVLEHIDDLFGLQPPSFSFPFPSFDPFVSDAVTGLDLPEATSGGSPITPVTFENGTKNYVIRGVFSNDSFSYNMTASLAYGTVAADGTITEYLNEIASKTIDVMLDATNADAPVCSASVTGDLDFGSLAYGDTSDPKQLLINNTGTGLVDVDISATHWLYSHDEPIMDVGQTRYSLSNSNDAYADRTPMSEADATLVSGLLLDLPYYQYLQVQIGDISSNFAGQLTQTITTTATCSS